MVRQTVDVLRKRVGIIYGENIPLERTTLVDWFLSRLEGWGTSSGMEAFRDESDGRLTMMLGGKVIVVDINLAVDRSDAEAPKINLISVKTSYAVPNGAGGAPTTAGSISLDGFLADSLRAFLTEIQKDEELQDPEEASRISSRIADDFKYLMDLDQLALREGDQGLRWFNSMDMLAAQAESVASKEAKSVAQ